MILHNVHDVCGKELFWALPNANVVDVQQSYLEPPEAAVLCSHTVAFSKQGVSVCVSAS